MGGIWDLQACVESAPNRPQAKRYLQRLGTCPSRLKKFLPIRYNMMLVKAHIFAVFFGIPGEASIEESHGRRSQEKEREELNEHSRSQRHSALDEKVKNKS